MPPRPQMTMSQREQSSGKRTKDRFGLANFLKKLALEPMLIEHPAPPMPRALSRSTLTPLKMRPGGVRHLKEMQIMTSFENDARLFFEEKIAHTVNADTLKSLRLHTSTTKEPTKNRLHNTKRAPHRFSSRNDVARAIRRGPVKDACALARILISRAPGVPDRLAVLDHDHHDDHSTPSTTSPAKQDRNNHGAIEPIFIRHTRMASNPVGSIKCIVVPVAPWEFSRMDFMDFTMSQKWPDRNRVRDRIRDKSLTNANLMWGYVHDLCVKHQCSNFVLTSYEMWAFGLFSPYYTLGSISNAFPWNWCSPLPHCSVLEMFVYWILVAFDSDVPPDRLRIEADYKNAQEYKYFNEACCSIGDILDVDPDAVLALCHAS